MALIPCPECGNMISNTALSCPRCGFDVKDYMQRQNAQLKLRTREDHAKRQILTEISSLVKKVKPITPKCPPDRASVCIRCGSVFYADNTPSCDCKYPGIEVDYPIQQSGTPPANLYILKHDILQRMIGASDTREYKTAISNIKIAANGSKPEPPMPEYQGLSSNFDNRLSNASFDLLMSMGVNFNTIKQLNMSDPTRRVPIIPINGTFDINDKPMQDCISTIAHNRVIAEIIAERTIERVEQSRPVCPICGSENLSRISVASTAAKVYAFGIFGAGDVGKTWKCNKCGSKF